MKKIKYDILDDFQTLCQGKIHHGFQKLLNPPSPKNPECCRFLHLAKKEFKCRPDIDKFEIYDETTLDSLTKCYRPSDTHGWYGTNTGDDISNPQFDIKADHSWVFCTDECFPDMTYLSKELSTRLPMV